MSRTLSETTVNDKTNRKVMANLDCIFHQGNTKKFILKTNFICFTVSENRVIQVLDDT